MLETTTLLEKIPKDGRLGEVLSTAGYIAYSEYSGLEIDSEIRDGWTDISKDAPKQVINWISDMAELHGYSQTKDIMDSIEGRDHTLKRRKIKIGFDGINRSGKSTTIEKMKEIYGMNFDTSRPFLLGGPYNELVKYLFDMTDISIVPEPLSATLFMFSEAYSDIIEEEKVYDRTPFSMAIHQAALSSIWLKQPLKEILKTYLKGFEMLFDVSKIIYLRVEPKTAIERSKKADRYLELKDSHKEHIERMSEAYELGIEILKNTQVITIDSDTNCSEACARMAYKKINGDLNGSISYK